MENLNTAEKDRERVIVRTGVIGIIANILLASFKAVVGLMTNSIAIVLDAVNNTSDAAASLVTVIGTKLASKAPDKKHPMGYGRLEYLSSMVVAALVLYAGITSVVESIKKIISPEKAEYTAASLIIVSSAIVVKLLLGLYVRKKGRAVNSGALTAAGSDALFDAVISASVLMSALIYLFSGISLEAYVGVLISAFIIKAGLEMLNETLNDILGKRADPDTVAEVKRVLCSEPEIRGAYDLILYNYGPNKDYASVHVELPDTMTVEEVDRLCRKAELDVFRQTGVIITGIGVYSYNTSDDEAAKIRDAIQRKLLAYDWALQLHGFYADTAAKKMRFDVVISFDMESAEANAIIRADVEKLYPGYELMIITDREITDITT